MNTLKPEEILAKHVEWESMTYYSKVQKSILAAMEEYAKAYAPVQEERACPCLYLDEPCHPMCTCKIGVSSLGCIYCCTYGSLEQRKHSAIRISNFIKAGQAAPVPGKEEDLFTRNEVMQAMGFASVGHSEKTCNEYLNKLKSASPSTASNEDINPETGKEYFSTLTPEKFSKHLGGEAVQQAAKEWINDSEHGYPIDKAGEWMEQKLTEAFLAGASFNKDAVEFAEWILKKGYYTDGSAVIWFDNFTHYTTQELYNLYLDSIKQIKQ